LYVSVREDLRAADLFMCDSALYTSPELFIFFTTEDMILLICFDDKVRRSELAEHSSEDDEDLRAADLFMCDSALYTSPELFIFFTTEDMILLICFDDKVMRSELAEHSAEDDEDPEGARVDVPVDTDELPVDTDELEDVAEVATVEEAAEVVVVVSAVPSVALRRTAKQPPKR
jgi:hypothetical protein